MLPTFKRYAKAGSFLAWHMYELSTFKNPQSKRFKALRKMMPLVDRFIGLTGTPAPNGLPDLWSQIYLMDRGERLGKTLSAFRGRFLKPGRRNGYVVYEWKLQDGAEEYTGASETYACRSSKVTAPSFHH